MITGGSEQSENLGFPSHYKNMTIVQVQIGIIVSVIRK